MYYCIFSCAVSSLISDWIKLFTGANKQICMGNALRCIVHWIHCDANVIKWTVMQWFIWKQNPKKFLFTEIENVINSDADRYPLSILFNYSCQPSQKY